MKTTISLHRRLLDRPEFRTADFDIKWVERWLASESD
jgi:biotin carboxylase